MTASAPGPPGTLSSEVEALIDQRKLDELEDLWTRRMEQAPDDLSFFFGVASAVKKKGIGASALAWLRFLADYQAERGDEDSRLTVLMEMARMSPTETETRQELADALRARYASHPALSAVLAHHPLEKAADPAAVAGKIRRWLSFMPGDISFLPGRGPGRIVEMNPALDVIRLDFSGTRLPFSLVSAEKTLLPLPGGHFLRDKIEQPQKLAALAEQDAAEAVRRLLESFGRPMAVNEIKEHFGGLVEESRWGSFWAAARKHPQLLVSGTGKTAMVSWSSSAGAADDEVRRSFAQALPAQKIEIARKNFRRAKELARFFGESLAACARDAAGTNPALAWELSQAAGKVLPGEPEAFPAERLLESRDLTAVLGQIHDHAARQAALEAIRERRSDWADLYAEHLPREEDARVLAMLFEKLGEIPERREELSRRILRSPRQAPRAFLWLCERLLTEAAPAPPHLFLALLEALRQEEFSGLRARVKEFFDPGNLAVSLARTAASEERAREYLDALDRVSRLEEHRRSVVKEALLMAFPGLRAPSRDYLYATPEAIETRRQELTRLRQVELPANAEAMRAAKEHGDLTENFEYHAARQRHEYLSARIATLTDELSRSRALDPARTDVSEVRVGTRVILREIGTGTEKSATILGPWDSRPEEFIYSYQSEFAEQLLGKKPGDRVSLAGIEAEVVRIAPWR
ncbi:MAG TPA: GreA/GreB family elongation factor [Thermoanaerobaculia bacterium]|nr:GreA/GreB family elongation factor [Thermoanaerobaculia bacterium]